MMRSLLWATLNASLLCVSGSVYPVVQAHVSTHRDLGAAVGTAVGDRVRGWLQSYSPLQALKSFTHTDAGKKAYTSLVSSNCAAFPMYCEEAHGLAESAKIPVSEVMIMCLRHELISLARKHNFSVQPSLECTDVLGFGAFAHNEDADVALKDFGFYVNASIAEDSSSYFAFQYPASLAGHAFSFNPRSGLAFSMNYVGPKEVNTAGLGVYFLTRACLDARSLNDAIQRLNVSNGAYGGSFNIGAVGSRGVVNVEFGPDGAISTRFSQGRTPVFHMNEYLRLDIPFDANPSSEHRLARAQAISTSQGGVDRSHLKSFWAILGDTQDEDYPLYRSATAATATFDLLAKPPVLLVHERGNPLDTTTHVALFDLSFGNPHSPVLNYV